MSLKSFIHSLCGCKKSSHSHQSEILAASKSADARAFADLRQETILFYNQKLLSSKESGVTKERLCEHEVIVSLTTFGARIEKVYLTIESIMQGIVKPNRIILWLSKDEFVREDLPAALLRQQERGLQIEFCEDIRSYKKLIPTLKKYPEACVITIDDDVMYEMDFLDKFVRFHKQHPQHIGVTVARKIRTDAEGKIMSYLGWHHIQNENAVETPYILGVGVGGIMYPPKSLHADVLNQELFMELCPYGDDIWFYAMAILNGTKTQKLPTQNVDGDFVDIYADQPDALSVQNVNERECRNDKQIKAVFDHYKLWDRFKVNA